MERMLEILGWHCEAVEDRDRWCFGPWKKKTSMDIYCIYLHANFGGTWIELYCDSKWTFQPFQAILGPCTLWKPSQNDATFGDNPEMAACFCSTSLWPVLLDPSVALPSADQTWRAEKSTKYRWFSSYKPPFSSGILVFPASDVSANQRVNSEETSLFKHGPYTKPVWSLSSNFGSGTSGTERVGSLLPPVYVVMLWICVTDFCTDFYRPLHHDTLPNCKHFDARKN